MDDDIRNRFRGISRGARDSVPAYQPRPEAPPPKPEPPKPIPKAAKPQKAKKRRRKRTKKTKLIVLMLLLVLLAGGGAAYTFLKSKNSDSGTQQQTQTPQAAAPAEAKPTGTIRFVAVGDSLAFESINNAAKQPDGSYNYAPMMSAFKPFFDKSDIRLCNQTTAGGGDANGLAISGYPTFNAPLAWSSGFADTGCNLINLASDHINDKGQPAIDATRTTWDSAKGMLAVAGANRSADEQSKISYFTVKGLKFAYLAYTTNTINKSVTPFGLNQYSDELAVQQITEARTHAKMVIVSMHWGVEDSVDISADQDRIAQHLATQNVDIVVGSGPRVMQPVKLLSGTDGHQTLAWFSLGNFLNSQLRINNLIGGMAVMDIDAATQKVKTTKLLPVYMHYEWTAAQKSASNINARHDFKLFPLDSAAEALGRSQNATTVEAQTTRVTGIVNTFTPVQVITSSEF